MKTATRWRVCAASDPGLARGANEDRVLADDSRGIFLVVDGLGGHAAGELAAETAVQTIGNYLDIASGTPEEQVRHAITAANNRIYELAQGNAEWSGMACVLTLALAHGDHVTVGQVGDSRLYLMWNGRLRKLTSDHSPVGEQEDRGELSEVEAMRHPRRNEVFRDVGSYPHNEDDAQFIETRTFLFRPDAALLLCSDGLSDFVTSAEITSIVERYDGDAERVTQELVEAANAAGGHDNISVVFVAGPDFLGSESGTLQETRSRHATTRMRTDGTILLSVLRSVLLVLAGMALGMLLWRVLDRVTDHAAPQKEEAATSALRSPKYIAVNSSDSLGIIKALSSAMAGDTITVPPGEYLGPLQLKDRVEVVATVPWQAIIRSDPASSGEPGAAVVASGVSDARVSGFRIMGDETHPLHTGVLIEHSSIDVDDLEISGALDCGVRVEGASHPLLAGNYIHGNAGPGVIVGSQSEPRLSGNHISENGRVARALRAGIEIAPDARPVLEHNTIVQNGAPPLLPSDSGEIRSNNTFDLPKVRSPSRGSTPLTVADR